MQQYSQKWIAISVAFLVLQTSNWAVAAPQVPSPDRSVEQQLRKIEPGSKVEVRLTGNNRVKGKLGLLYNDAFELQVTDGGSQGPRRIAFADVQSVRKAGMGRGKKIAIGLGIFGAVAALVAGLTLAAIARNG
jgi:hypothetical protein